LKLFLIIVKTNPSLLSLWVAIFLGLGSFCQTQAQMGYPVSYASQQQAQAHYYQQQQPAYARPAVVPGLRFDGRFAAVPLNFPIHVKHAVQAGNAIQRYPYRRGGGHARVDDNAYDCSGSVSFVLIKSGLLRSPLNSTGFVNYGNPGPGRFITLFIKPGDHVFMTVCGLRLDTTGGRRAEGPRWRPTPRDTQGFIIRHPPGL